MGAMSEAKPKPKELKDEVSYGALIYTQIMNCLRESVGREITVDIGTEHGIKNSYSITSYERLHRAVDFLVSLVSVVADEEFNKELKEIEEWAKEAQEEASKTINDELEAHLAYHRFLYGYSRERFQACLDLLRRKGMIIEEVLKGARI
jgi:histidinol phosphatase-like PHP family hydrolase